MWIIGVIAYRMLNLEDEPFPGKNYYQKFWHQTRGAVKQSAFVHDSIFMPIISSMLQVDPSKRVSPSELFVMLGDLVKNIGVEMSSQNTTHYFKQISALKLDCVVKEDRFLKPVDWLVMKDMKTLHLSNSDLKFFSLTENLEVIKEEDTSIKPPYCEVCHTVKILACQAAVRS